MDVASTSESLFDSSRASYPAPDKAPASRLSESASQKARDVPSPVLTRASTPVTNISILRTTLVSPRTPPYPVQSPARSSRPASTSRVSPSSLTVPQQRILACVRELSSRDPATQGAHLNDIVLTLREEDDRWTADAMLYATPFHCLAGGFVLNCFDFDYSGTVMPSSFLKKIIT